MIQLKTIFNYQENKAKKSTGDRRGF